MKRLALTPPLFAATLFLAAAVQAEETKAPAVSTTESSGAMKPARADDILKRFDKNGDGKLDDDERADAHEAMLKEQMSREAARATAPGGEQFRARMLELFDKNHDGRLDDEERAEARKYAADRGLPEFANDLIKRFDKNGDGKLDLEERAVMEKFLLERRNGGVGPVAMREQLLRQFDKNADGKIDETETTDLESFVRPRVEANPKQMLRYDQNGDGKLDDQEWAGARQEIIRWVNTGDAAAFMGGPAPGTTGDAKTSPADEQARLSRVAEEVRKRREARERAVAK